MTEKKKSLIELDDAGLKSLVAALGEPPYRVKQIRHGLFRGLAFSFDEMTDLPLSLRQRLGEETRLHALEPAAAVLGKDGTVKTLFTLADGNTIEAALMAYDPQGGRPRHTVCVSTQVGCAIGCPFCATGQQGFIRNLTSGEIIDQVLYFARYLKDNNKEASETGDKPGKVTNVVFMGMGEPLANYDNLWRAIEILNSPEGFGLGARNLTISTAGLAPQIKRLAQEKLQVGLAVSLHAGEDTLRDGLVPVNRKYPLEELIGTCRDYYRATGRRVSFEYVLFSGINDSLSQARALARLLRGLNCHVNLIPANKTPDSAFQPPPRQAVLAFEKELVEHHINATLRQPRGQDIDAGCGQLRSRYVKAAKKRPGVTPVFLK
jgi:23S rRNA (adenine2503-C2)-methyltransferase